MRMDVKRQPIDCVCGWRGFGCTTDPCPTCGSTQKKQLVFVTEEVQTTVDPQTPEFWRMVWKVGEL